MFPTTQLLLWNFHRRERRKAENKDKKLYLIIADDSDRTQKVVEICETREDAEFLISTASIKKQIRKSVREGG